MALIVETGVGVQGSESYAAITAIDAYWLARQHIALAATWAATTIANKEGSAREASAFLDAVYGRFYRGQRAGYVQGLEWPRSGALDDAGYALPSLPPQLVAACCELAGRAVSAPLAADLTIDGVVKRKRETVGPITEETEYVDGAGRFSRYGAIDGILSAILNGSQPIAGNNTWNWR